MLAPFCQHPRSLILGWQLLTPFLPTPMKFHFKMTASRSSLYHNIQEVQVWMTTISSFYHDN